MCIIIYRYDCTCAKCNLQYLNKTIAPVTHIQKTVTVHGNPTWLLELSCFANGGNELSYRGICKYAMIITICNIDNGTEILHM